ncbi:ankyrin repeat domain-containing protein 49 isoform X1 [Moschus berezovskii]|uniref:ankyrin repeat domain-containing protein 49 isoform X1 n=1 Tax=Moschus berezovskii TaxID=68408 RepID=UPI002444C18F|nr:ankyrin repeat domain-containing protein 49 isoform X1 [Moschus berezovskii]
MEKEKVNDEKSDSENSLDFSEHFNQLELLETHGHLIPTGTQSLWVGNSDDDEEQDEKTEEWYQLQEKTMEKDPSKLLLWAAEKNRLTTVRRLLSERATHVNTRDEDKYTPLHRAAYSGHLDVVRELIAHGADVHAVTVDGWTPLHSAYLSNIFKNWAKIYIMRNAGLEEAQAGIKIVRRNINNLRYADDTSLVAESEEELKSLLKVKEESEKVGLKLNIQKTKIMASGPITSWDIDGETVETVSDFIFGGSKITVDADCSDYLAWRAVVHWVAKSRTRLSD